MKESSGSLIQDAFDKQMFTPDDFRWFEDYINANLDKFRLQNFTVYNNASQAQAVVSVRYNHLGELANEVATYSPYPYTFTVLSLPSPNPGDGTVVIGWGGGK